jgi:hypothetical protein
MEKKERQQLLGLEILRLDDTTLWKRALKSPRRRTNKKKLIFGRYAMPGLLTVILDRLKRPR